MAEKDMKIDDKDFLGGFQEVFEIGSNENKASSASSTKEEIDQTNVKTVDPSFFEADEEDDESLNENNDEKKETKERSKKKPTSEEEEDGESEEENTEEELEEEENQEDEGQEKEEPTTEDEEDDSGVEEEHGEEELVSDFFDVFAQELGWEYTDEEKPKSISGLIDFMGNIIEKGSQPNFADSSVKEINDFIANGGTLDDYVKQYSSITELDSMDLTGNEEAQKKVIREQLTNSGISEDTIERRIERYEDTGILEDEAKESQELLKKYNQQNKEKLLKDQENRRQEAEKQQQKFINDVKSTIDEIKDIKGIPLTKQQKDDLKKYLFEVDKNGQTQYQKDYSKSYEKLIESAFFTKEGDSIVNTLQKKAGSDATKKLKKRLKTKDTKRSKSQASGGSGSSSSALDMISAISKNLSN